MATDNMPRLEYSSDAVLGDMTVDELEELNAAFMQVKASVRRWQLRINAIMSDKLEREDALRRIRDLTPDQYKHLAQVVQAEGIPSQESVNG